MAMTMQERATKNYIYSKLREEGYPTYASIFAKLDLHLTNSPRVVGFMNPKDGSITINRNLDEDQFSVIIRHEILHSYLQHEKRLLDHLAEQRGIDPNKIDDLSLQELKSFLYGDKTFNIAADYEISNRGYTEEDKQTVRNILLNGETISGLVTEDEHPEWVNWDVEDMYDALLQEKERAEQEAQNDMNNQEEDDGNETNDSSDGDSSSQDGDRQNNQKQDGQQQDGQNGSSSDKNGQDDGNEDGDEQETSDSSSGGNGGNSKVVYGRFVDEHTFIDENGNEVRFGD